MSTPASHRRLPWALPLCLAAATLTGCVSSPTTLAVPARDYSVAYRAGDYARAARIASQAPVRSDQARLVEGMSRAELDETEQAKSILRPLLRSSDAEIRGRAAATLGLISQEEGKNAEAARLLTLAADTLAGSDGVWAAHYAANVQQEVGNTQAAARLADRAAPASNLLNRGGTGEYLIQFGSFSSEARADRHALAIKRLTRSTGVTDPVVEQVQRGARVLYAVRSGPFVSQSAASAAAARLDTETAVMRTQ